MTQEQDEAFAAALRQLSKQYPVDPVDLGAWVKNSERYRGLERLERDGSPSAALIWFRRTGIPEDELHAVAMLIYGELP